VFNWGTARITEVMVIAIGRGSLPPLGRATAVSEESEWAKSHHSEKPPQPRLSRLPAHLSMRSFLRDETIIGFSILGSGVFCWAIKWVFSYDRLFNINNIYVRGCFVLFRY
jgi:hypothetical protein